MDLKSEKNTVKYTLIYKQLSDLLKEIVQLETVKPQQACLWVGDKHLWTTETKDI